MPTRPPRPCYHPGCPNLVERGYCEAHQPEPSRKRTRPPDYGTKKHKRWRAEVMRRYPLCADPEGFHEFSGVHPASEIADHIIPVRDGGDWTMENAWGLCRKCHARKTARDNRQRELARKKRR